MAYATVAELKKELQATDTTDRHDDLMGDCLDEASAAIDDLCHRTFVVPVGVTSRFYSTSRDGRYVDRLDDISVVTDLAVATDDTDSGTYTALGSDDWFSIADNVNGAIEEIRLVTPRYPSSQGRKNVRVTARFGWPATPSPVHRACIILARRYYTRKNSAAGVLGFDAMGATVRLSRVDPDVQALLAPYVKYSGLLA